MSKRNSRETLIFQCFSGVFSLLGVKDESIAGLRKMSNDMTDF